MSNLKEYPERKWLLKISNYSYFNEIFNCGTSSYYKAAHQLLCDLEKEIQFKEKLEEVILIPYKDDGDVIFRLKRIEYGDLKESYAIYEFDTTVS